MLFDIARYARIFAWPALLAWLGVSRGGGRGGDRFDPFVSGFETWLWVLVLPSVALSVARFLSFRLRYEPDALVIRSGILFRNVRHVPYARIQNLDAVQNLAHRALGVVEVRIETGGGGEPEARLRVLPVAALAEMRARVFAGRAVPSTGAVSHPPVASAEATVSPDSRSSRPQAGPFAERADAVRSSPSEAGLARELLRLSWRDLLLLGFLENKGMVLVGAAYGALWEAGVMDRIWNRLFDDAIDLRGLGREVLAAFFGRAPLPTGRLMLALGGVVGFLLLVRLISMAWALVRLYDFRLTRRGDDLRVTYGLFTRVSATIPLGRVQTMTVHRSWLQRRLGRAAIRVETAGGKAGAATRDREWVAPLVHIERVPALVAEVLPGIDLDTVAWRGVHPRAFRRAIKPALLAALAMSAVMLAALGWRASLVAVPLVAWVAFSTRQRVRRLAWLASDTLVAFRSGWLAQAATLVRVNRIQVVTFSASPFDRRAHMARVRVDTAGAGERSHRVDIPYLDETVAREVHRQLARAAARTAFQW